MRLLLVIAVMVLMSSTGCFLHKSGGAKGQGSFSDPPHTGSSRTVDGKMIITPETGLSGKVVRVVSTGRFAVLNFPVGRMPAIDQRVEVYRQGLKVGELRITGPQLDDNIVADILTGEVQPGDQVRVQ